MKISEEMVRQLQKRIDVTYEEAEDYLNRAKGDIDLAYEMIMRKRNSTGERIVSGFSQILDNLMKYRFIITRKQELILNIPLLIVVLFFALDGLINNIFVVIVLLVIALATECEFKIKKKSDINPSDVFIPKETSDLNRKADEYNKSQRPTHTEREVEKEVPITQVVKPSQNVQQKSEQDDDYYEIVIEE